MSDLQWQLSFFDEKDRLVWVQKLTPEAVKALLDSVHMTEAEAVGVECLLEAFLGCVRLSK